MNFNRPPKIEQETFTENISPEKVLKTFDLELSDKERELILTKIDKVDHIGILVSDINDALEKLNLRYPEAKYEITKQFNSVGIPKNYEGSTSTIAHIRSRNMAYVGFEFFVVNWGEKYEGISDEQKKRFIEHTALNAGDQQGVEEVINILTDKSSNIAQVMPPQTNQSSGEIFAYLTNKQGMKIEIVHHIQSTTDHP